MARILITGSSTGLGLLAGKRLTDEGHEVVLHARDEARAQDTRRALPSVRDVIVGDLQTIRGAKDIARQANDLGRFDAVIHNAGIYQGKIDRTEDGLPPVFAVNVLAPYVLTSLMALTKRLIYLSSDMHAGADLDLNDVTRDRRGMDGIYSESKLQVLLLMKAVARLRPDAYVNAVDPGWVPTRMGGKGATGDLDKGAETQVRLAAPAPGGALGEATGQYFHHLEPRSPDTRVADRDLQDRLLDCCRELSGVDPAKPAGG